MENNSAIIYARVSSSGYLVNRQDTSRQVADLQTYADFAQLKVIKVFEEHISGAKKKDERPVLIEAMNFCKQNNIGMVLVSELSRLGRNAFEDTPFQGELAKKIGFFAFQRGWVEKRDCLGLRFHWLYLLAFILGLLCGA